MRTKRLGQDAHPLDMGTPRYLSEPKVPWSRRPAFYVAACLSTAGISALLTSLSTPALALQLALALVLLVICIAFDARRDQTLPFLLRPGVAVTASVLVGAIAAPDLNQEDYFSYLILWSALVVGVLAGLLLTQSNLLIRAPKASRIDSRILRTSSLVLLAISLGAALIFFAWQGVPALSGNVEQGRVDAAAEGTGYVRLLAYMGIPAVHMLFALRDRLAFPALIVATLIIFGLANRSPFLYLFVPLLLLFFAQKRIRLTSLRIILAVAAILVLILGIGTFRVFSQDDFAKYDEYRSDIASEDYLSVAMTSFTHYASVVADNAVLTKKLVDDGSLPHQFGATYFTLFISALPGEQLSLDRLIKEKSGKAFLGGGTPPTLMGEGYVNFGLAGTVLIGSVVVFLLRFWSRRYADAQDQGDPVLIAVTAAVYGYMLCWVVGSPVAGLAGASTVPLAGAILSVLLRSVSLKTREN